MNNSGKAAAWSSTTKTWTQVVLGSGYGGLAGSGGSFVVANSGGTAAAWERGDSDMDNRGSRGRFRRHSRVSGKTSSW